MRLSGAIRVSVLPAFCALVASVVLAPLSGQRSSMPARLIIVDPGHFHATLLQKEMYPDIASRVSVYAPLGPELLDYLNRISLFNTRAQDPTRWEMDVHCTARSMDEVLNDRAGNVVVFTGKNRGKIERIALAASAGFHVLADKPWIISSGEMPLLEKALATSGAKHVVAYDIMTERYEVTSELQRALVNTPEVFGELEPGTTERPGVYAKSIHHVMKVVAGVPLRRPAWFFDVGEYGEGLADVGTHVVDLVQWTAFPDQSIDYRKDIQVLAGHRSPLTLTKTQFKQVTGEPDFPAALAGSLRDGQLDYYCNNSVHYALKGIHVKLDILWNWEAPEGSGDIYEAAFTGTKARAEIRQGKNERFLPELYIVPVSPVSRSAVFTALRAKVQNLQSHWPGLGIQESGMEARLVIPEKYRVGHEAHFAQVARQFFAYVRGDQSMPAWEQSFMLAKYYVTTKGVELARQ